MGRQNDLRAGVEQGRHDRVGDRRGLAVVGGGERLVAQQHSARPQDLGDLSHAGQFLVQPPVFQIRILGAHEMREHTVAQVRGEGRGRDEHTGLHHQPCRADAAQEGRLAAAVRAADHEECHPGRIHVVADHAVRHQAQRGVAQVVAPQCRCARHRYRIADRRARPAEPFSQIQAAEVEGQLGAQVPEEVLHIVGRPRDHAHHLRSRLREFVQECHVQCGGAAIDNSAYHVAADPQRVGGRCGAEAFVQETMLCGVTAAMMSRIRSSSCASAPSGSLMSSSWTKLREQCVRQRHSRPGAGHRAAQRGQMEQLPERPGEGALATLVGAGDDDDPLPSREPEIVAHHSARLAGQPDGRRGVIGVLGVDIGELRGDLGIAERGPVFGEFADESKIVEIEPQFGVESRDRGRDEIAMPFGVLFEPAKRPGMLSGGQLSIRRRADMVVQPVAQTVGTRRQCGQRAVQLFERPAVDRLVRACACGREDLVKIQIGADMRRCVDRVRFVATSPQNAPELGQRCPPDGCPQT